MASQILFDIGWGLSRFVGTALMGAQVRGVNHLPRSGAFILASNHRSYLDPTLVGCFVPRRMHFFAKKELFDVPILGPIIRAVNAHPVRRGGFDRAAIKEASRVLERGHGLVVFPEGTRASQEEFLDPKSGVGMIARETNTQIVPCYIENSNHFWPCLIRRLRLRVSYGEPISREWIARQSDSKEGWSDIADEVMTRIRALRDDLRPAPLADTSARAGVGANN